MPKMKTQILSEIILHLKFMFRYISYFKFTNHFVCTLVEASLKLLMCCVKMQDRSLGARHAINLSFH